MDGDLEWADFISSTHDGMLTINAAGVRGGVPVSLNLGSDLDLAATPPVPGSGTV